MSNIVNPLLPAKIQKSNTKILDSKYNVLSLTYNDMVYEKIISNDQYIMLLPFDRTSDNKIKSIYCLTFENPQTNKDDGTLLFDTIDKSKDSTTYDSIGRILLEEAGLNLTENNINEDSIYYLGNVSTFEPMISNFKCYGIDLTKLNRPNKPIEFTRTLSKYPYMRDNSKIEQIGFHEIVAGNYSDATILSGCFLLISYFS